MARFERWLEVKQIFEEALEVPTEGRPAFLDRVCQGDEELRREVEALLTAPAVPTSSFAELFGLPEPRDEPDYVEGDTIDHFRIVRRIGKGGMGVVYEARDTRNNDRSVAIKVLFTGAIKLSQDKRLAGFSSPTIVTFHDSGATSEGLPYFVFEYIEGEPITTYCEHRGLPDRLRLFERVCDAVRYAHQRLVIHCDLKPENILVTATGELKLLDFGIARGVGGFGDSSRYPAPITLPFASPEQVGNEETTTLSDVYSLGVLLCVLLTGRLPYQHARTDAALREAILREDPTAPSDLVRLGAKAQLGDGERAPFSLPPPHLSPRKLVRRLRGDLDAIVLRALRKEPDQRYATVQELSADIERFVKIEPVAAHKPSLGYRAWKLLRRRKGAAIAAMAVVLVAAMGFGVWWRQFRETTRERDLAQREAAHAKELNDFLFRIFLVYNPDQKPGDPVTVRALLDQARAELSGHLQPEVQIRLLHTLGDLYQDYGLQDETEKCLKAALALARRQSPNDRFLATASLTRLGILRKLQGRHAEAEALLRGSLAIREPRVPPTDPDITDSLFQLADTLREEGRYQEAEILDQRALELRQRAQPIDQATVAQSMKAVGSDLAYMGHFDEAEPYLRKSLRVREGILPPGHPLLANSREDLANVLINQGKYEEGIKIQKEVVAARHRARGSKSQQGAGGNLNLGGFQLLAGDPPAAELALRDALSEGKNVYDSDHPILILTRMQLGRALFLQGKFAEAERLIDEAYSLGVKRFGPQHFLVGATLQARAQYAYQRKDFVAAERNYRRALEIFRASQGFESKEVLSTGAQLGTILTRLHRFSEAEPLLLAYYKKSNPQAKRDAGQRLVQLYEDWGNAEKAAVYRDLMKTLPPSPAIVKPGAKS